jgi:hypothetical protein
MKQKRYEIRCKIWGKEIKDDLKEFDINIKEPETQLK